jgi:hypothetical protein
LGILVHLVESIKRYVSKDLRPYFIDKGLFHTPGFSGIVATARIAEHFNRLVTTGSGIPPDKSSTFFQHFWRKGLSKTCHAAAANGALRSGTQGP